VRWLFVEDAGGVRVVASSDGFFSWCLVRKKGDTYSSGLTPDVTGLDMIASSTAVKTSRKRAHIIRED